MRIIAASDTHGRNDRLLMLEEAYPDADLYIHAGDFEDNPARYPKWFGVKGNMDWIFDPDILPLERIVDKDGLKIYLTHSNQFSPIEREEQIARRARQLGCNLAVYGHTHVPKVKQVEEFTCINPGSLSSGRGGKPAGFSVIDVEVKTKAKTKHESGAGDSAADDGLDVNVEFIPWTDFLKAK